MAQSDSNFLVRSLRFVWDAVNFSRRLVLNGLFVLIVVVLVIGAFSGGASLDDRTALVLAPRGSLVEQFSVDPGSRALAQLTGDEIAEVQVRDVVRGIDAAAADSRIERLVIRPDQLASGGMVSLREVGAALKRFKASGKQIVAYADGMDQRGYYLAAHADEIYLHPGGAVLLEGLGRYRAYYREGLQDKLGVKVHLFRVGEFKSFAEPYILDAPSDAAREADLFWMGDVWRRYLEEIAELRKLDADVLQSSIDGIDTAIEAVEGDLAQLALKQGLVTELKTLDEFRALMIERGVEDQDGHSFLQVDLDQYLGFVDREHLPFDARPQIAIIVAQGGITDGEQPQGSVGGVSTSALIRRAREDDDVHALVLRVDSPGGGVFPSEQIRREVELTKAAGKPVVVSMANVAASGGYWISMNADEIFADPSTITGSIGIFGLWLTGEETLAKVGARVDGVGTTAIAGAFDPMRPMNPIVGKVLQSVIESGYRDFIGKVAAAREKPVADIDAVARGRVWSGAQAAERGLVDTLGGLQDAIASAAERAGLEKDGYGSRYIEEEPSPFESFLADLSRNAAVQTLALNVGLPAVLGMENAHLQRLEAELTMMAAPVRGTPIRAVAHCFCELD